MTEDRAYLDKQRSMAAPGAAEDPKSRQCLKCRKQFPSEWAGQRVCAPNCPPTSLSAAFVAADCAAAPTAEAA